jgi:vancomycin resistance protein YoaR
VALFVFITAAVVGLFQLRYEGLIYPGVSAMGIDLGGMSPQDAFLKLSVAISYPNDAIFTFCDGDRCEWQVRAADLGVSIDAAHTANTAYGVGRSSNLLADLGDQLDAWLDGTVVAPRMVYDETRAAEILRSMAAGIDIPMQNAAVEIHRDELRATASTSQVGREVQIDKTLALIREHVLSMTAGEVPLVIEETAPQVWDATDITEEINVLLSAPLRLYIADPRPGDPDAPWIKSRQELAQMIVIEQVPNAGGETAHYEARLDTAAAREYLESIAPSLSATTSDARFIFNDETGQLEVLQDSINGRELNIDATLEAVEAAAFTDNHQVPLVFNEIIPTVHSGATAEELGIAGLVAQATTYFSGSSAVRQTNISVAASQFHGLVVAPGEEFSFNRYLGEVTSDAGYEEGFIIYDGRTVKGVGGGVCQVSTTAFQAAFYAGFPITERYPHGYRVGYYETGEGAGMDATVYEPIVDLKFINDTPYYLLIETYSDASRATLTFKFYSTGMNREVVKEGPFISNITPHGPTIYEENAALASGQRRQVEYAVNGADVTVRRLVYQDEELVRDDTFVSQYLPWQAVIQVAPGEMPGAQLAPEQNQSRE